MSDEESSRREFVRVMGEMGAVQDSEQSEPARYDPVRGDLLDGVWLWRTAAGRVVGRQERYYWRGEFQFVYRVIAEDE